LIQIILCERQGKKERRYEMVEKNASDLEDSSDAEEENHKT